MRGLGTQEVLSSLTEAPLLLPHETSHSSGDHHRPSTNNRSFSSRHEWRQCSARLLLPSHTVTGRPACVPEQAVGARGAPPRVVNSGIPVPSVLTGVSVTHLPRMGHELRAWRSSLRLSRPLAHMILSAPASMPCLPPHTVAPWRDINRAVVPTGLRRLTEVQEMPINKWVLGKFCSSHVQILYHLVY